MNTKRKKYPCNNCDESFKKYTHFKEHVKTHTGEKTYPCSYKDCEKTFKKSSHAKDHERTHTGEKAYSCIYCDKKYAQRTHGKEHERTHRGETPYPCKYCGKKFTRSNQARAHEKRIHLKKNEEENEDEVDFPNVPTIKKFEILFQYHMVDTLGQINLIFLCYTRRVLS